MELKLWLTDSGIRLGDDHPGKEKLPKF